MELTDYHCPNCGSQELTVEQLTWNLQDYNAADNDWSCSYHFDYETEYILRASCKDCEQDVTQHLTANGLMRFHNEPEPVDLCDCDGGEQGDGLCAIPHQPHCATLREDLE